MDHKNFIEYSDHLFYEYTIKESSIEEKDIFTDLTYALMNKNKDMVVFISSVLYKLGVKIDDDNGSIHDDDDNGSIDEIVDNTGKLGGGKTLKDYLYGIGIIIFAVFYDYYIITNGSWDRLNDSINKFQNLSSRIIEGCDEEYRPSRTISLLARATKDPSLLYRLERLEYAMQCVSTPTRLSSKLHSLDMEKKVSTRIAEMQKKFKDIPGFPQLPPSEMSTEVVPFGKDPEELKDFLNKKLLVYSNDDSKEIDVDDFEEIDMDGTIIKINLDETFNKFKLLADMSSDEFKKVFEKEQSMPTPTPTQAPIYVQSISFASDIIGAFTEIAPATFSPSFSFKNVFLWSLQDTIRDTIRKIEDGKTESKRAIEDLITNANRVFSDISSIPSLITFLFFLNLAAMRSFISFANKLVGIKKSRESYPQIKDVTEEEDVHPRRSLRIKEQSTESTGGGNRRKTHKRKHKRRTHRYKRGGKKRQTKGKKRGRVTRKR
jgi:hypothetical protein